MHAEQFADADELVTLVSQRREFGLQELQGLRIRMCDRYRCSALARKESRGLHFTLDYPQTLDDFLGPTILEPGKLTKSPAKLASI